MLTLKSVADGRVAGTIAREGLQAAETPQGFRFAAILDAHERAAAAGLAFTDDAAIAEWAGMTVTVVARDWMPEMKKTTIAPGSSVLDFQLKKGKTLRLRFVDSDGKPIPEVAVGIDGWRGGKSLYNVKHPIVLETQIPRRSDTNGVYEWTWAPDDQVRYQFWKTGFREMTKTLVADGSEQTIQLTPEK